jgi:hypothetical protein
MRVAVLVFANVVVVLLRFMRAAGMVTSGTGR